MACGVGLASADHIANQYKRSAEANPTISYKEKNEIIIDPIVKYKFLKCKHAERRHH